MRPLGTFLDFTRLYVYVHWMFFHSLFFKSLIYWPKVQNFSLLKILYIFGTSGQMKKLIILDIVTFVGFYMVHFPEYKSKWTDCFLVLCSNVVWNPFLMETTFTSDFSWFGSVFV